MNTTDARKTLSYDLPKQLAMAVSAIGLLLLLAHLAGQIREGSAPLWSLIVGAGCFLFGLILALLFAILIRLHSIECQQAESKGLGRSAGPVELQELPVQSEHSKQD